MDVRLGRNNVGGTREKRQQVMVALPAGGAWLPSPRARREEDDEGLGRWGEGIGKWVKGLRDWG